MLQHNAFTFLLLRQECLAYLFGEPIVSGRLSAGANAAVNIVACRRGAQSIMGQAPIRPQVFLLIFCLVCLKYLLIAYLYFH